MADFTISDIRINQQLNIQPLKKAVSATEDELVLLAEELTQVAIPVEVLLRVLKIANYDKKAAFDYAEQYLDKSKNPRRIVLNSRTKSCLKWSLRRIVKLGK
ncbi:hypothetical protein ACN23B_27280 (plasmid) [Anabaena sp. FACHB-709]|uniref:Uncharacterized protein n=2 Tax=Nostocaceae TaxID=1162 RepID=A0A1Z4KUN0_ANAVA|nr:MULTISPECIES: hypothetical protein [Nostocaceae]BAY72741.1 hypothetical protein NIES23_55690 [Trichormus variabilis NIES-23]MBD2174966.1 hypothetical protein [Anabaena cylindrica FACHB-318]MBD2266720.1 hypothetical protein [Anabaena sp. FACHB-709]MBD2276366.1 hypothetical protein [Nostoc sp. PCC 7120 = FACHB-418]MBD2286905.1 hypothetical protein [Anabaena cylindrica FACHB-170]